MRGRHDTNRLYGPRWNGEKYLTYGLLASRRMPPRKRSRVRDLCGLGAIRPPGPTEDARARPRWHEDARSRRVLAHPVERARAASCVVPWASRCSRSLSLFSSFRCSPPLPSARVSSVHYSSRCSLPETELYVRATLLLISSPPLSVAPYAFTIHAVSYFGPGCEDEVVPRKRSGMLTVARVLRDVETRQCDDTIIKPIVR